MKQLHTNQNVLVIDMHLHEHFFNIFKKALPAKTTHYIKSEQLSGINLISYANSYSHLIFYHQQLADSNKIIDDMQAHLPNLKVKYVFYEAMNEPDFFDLLRHEILGFISVHDTPENQKSGFLHFVRGEKFLSNGVMEIAYRKMLQKEKQQLASSDLLTERENEIMHLLHQGKPYHQVAEILHISIETVRTHCRNIYRKLDVHNLHEAVEALLQSANR